MKTKPEHAIMTFAELVAQVPADWFESEVFFSGGTDPLAVTPLARVHLVRDVRGGRMIILQDEKPKIP